MKVQNHIIKSITFDTAIANEELVDPWRNTIGRIPVESVFGRVLQPFDLQEEWTCIDRLEIDLGVMSWENEEEWNYKIMAAFEKQLADTIRITNTGIHYPQLMRTASAEEVTKVAIMDDDNYRLQALMEYLKTGVCPWQLHQHEDLGELVGELAENNPLLVEQELRNLLQRSASAVERMLMVLDYRQLVGIIKLFTGRDTVEDLISIYAFIEKRFPPGRRKVIRQKMLRMLLECSVAGSMDVEKFMETFFTGDFIALFDLSQWKHIQLIAGGETGHRPELVKTLRQTIQRVIEGLEKKAVTQHPEIKERGGKKIDIINRKTGLKDAGHTGKEDVEAREERIFIDGSGLVLLNPSLIKYHFEKLGWVREKNFSSESGQEKAILWLHYLVHGRDKAREYDLSLAKLLCGMLPSDIADVKLRLTGKERKDAGLMLETVIDSWTALKKVSIAGFRQSFLQREGGLSHDEAGWQLHVQSRAYDILIDQLPWSYSIIKLPWMPKPLFTQWSTRI